MSVIPGVEENVVGLVLVGAEGCAETADETWLRDATPEELELFKNFCFNLCRNAQRRFDFGDFSVDGNNRPYWLKAVLNTAPPVAIHKANNFTRVLRLID